jgi:hypothetical protein
MADKEIHARLVVFDLDTMSDHNYARFVKWLKDIVLSIEKDGRENYSKRFTARLMK